MPPPLLLSLSPVPQIYQSLNYALSSLSLLCDCRISSMNPCTFLLQVYYLK